MNQLVTTNESGQAVTTSEAIASGVGLAHKTVIQLIRKNQSDLEELGNTAFEMRNSNSGAGRPTEIAILNERQSTFLISLMRNSQIVKDFKKRLVLEFFRMADKLKEQPRSNELSRMDILELALESEKRSLRLEAQAEEDKPKVAFAEAVQERADDMDVRRAAQILSNTYGVSTGQQRLFTQLRELEWLDKKGRAYQRVVNQKLLREVMKTRIHPRTGVEIPYTQVMVTGKGLARLQELLSNDLGAVS